MELLSEKTKIDFENWLIKERNLKIVDTDREYDLYYLYKYMLPRDLKNALIIEWLDVVGIYVKISVIRMFYEEVLFKGKLENNCEVIESSDVWFKTRQEATIKAIEKANEIYNKV